jgi:hypothetical protein
MKRLFRIVMAMGVLIILAGVFPQPAAARKETPSHTLYEAELLMATSEELLATSQGIAGLTGSRVIMASRIDQDEELVDMAVVEAELNAVKAQRAQVDAVCRETRQANADDECFIKQLDAVCAQKMAELKAQEAALRVIWGDRRKGTTKFFGRINAFRRRVWHKIGIPGRRILRTVGDTVKQMVLSKQKVTSHVVRALLRKEVRREVKNYALQRALNKAGGNLKARDDCEKEMTEAQKRRLPDILLPDEGKTEFANFAGEWHGGGACAEGDDPAYRWNVSLNQDENGKVTGTISFHACPGGGAVYYDVHGQATKDKELTLSGEMTGGRGDLGENARSNQEFTVRYNKAPNPNLAQ